MYIALLLIMSMLAMGIFGFRFFAEYTWTDAVYMTMITISTVGFGEVQPLNDTAKVFTVILILVSVVVVGYAISIITEYILSRSNFELIKQRSVQKKIDKLNNHVIIVGYGRNGKQAAQKLMTYHKPFVVIELDEEVVNKFQSDDIPFVTGNANEDEILMAAGVARAATLISALPKDSDNLFVVLSARQINAKMKIISRASEETTYQKLKFAGANNVIMPDKIGGDHMASLVVVPDLLEFLDHLQVATGGRVNVQQINYDAVCPDHKSRAIRDIDLRNRTGCSIIGYKAPDGNYIINPEASLLLEKDSILIVIGRPEQIEKLHKEFAI
ncbi:potassium channel family protein [Leeuwenhoekiella marinoflava]|uniref:Voltage-gated potassium channel n=2 Tax=Leeuwenhoekiella marinoflava TaxID=988 RepID=A0A4Q0PIV0_9FLAO|nr:potassium channel protein [Leeuwenhoekiella marinoflava]RXG27061.1 voltage-gated potassium channel [Leeuwenhoekiella marinoflava]SHF43304.1 voltage-gated potassium channel [Leeuwenhoekiella marinoflava DSM 3653]